MMMLRCMIRNNLIDSIDRNLTRLLKSLFRQTCRQGDLPCGTLSAEYPVAGRGLIVLKLRMMER